MEAGASRRVFRPPIGWFTRSFRRADLFEQEHAFLVGRDDIEQAIAVEIGHDKLSADTALIVDFARGEGDLAIGSAAGFEPVQPGWFVGARLVLAVLPESLAGDEVIESITIDIRGNQGVSLGDQFGEQVVLREDGRAILRLSLLEPPDTVPVG